MTRLEDKSRIAGAGGGGGGKGGGGGTSHTPTESPDSLRSKQLARVLDLVSEGEIYGLVDGLKSVYLDDTPLQNADLSYNFSDVTVDWRVGTQSQTYIPGFAAVESETAVGVEVKAAVSVTRSISNASLSAVRVTISVPQLTYQNTTTGDLSGDTVQIAIDLQTNGGGYVEQLVDTISGKTTTTYQRAYRIELTGVGPWDVRVRRITADSTESNRINATWWQSYTEIIDHLLRYPNSGLVGVQIDASQFKNIPRRGFHLKGLKIRVPTNYDPATRTYVGNWDGTFKIEYSNNPAWCWYDMIVSERYGLGEFIDAAQVDKWALYTIGQYCDGLVDNGFGGTEPRFTCNLYLQTREEAYNVLQNMASIFRGMVFESGGFVTAVQDAPADAVALFTPANVTDGMFNYAGSSIKARHTVALVSWNDPADRYKQKIEYVEDEEGIGRYGVRETEIAAAGCTSRGQAHRVGKWLLYTERLETETITFRAGLDAAYCRPGDVIKVADPNIAAVRLGGRVLDASTSSVTIDSPVTIVSGRTYDLSCILPDGTVATRTLNNGPGSASVLTFTTVLTTAPAVHSVWLLADIGQVEPQTFRVLGVAEVEKTQVEIVALAHNPGKYAAIETGIELEPPPISENNFSVQIPVSSVTVTKNTEKRQDGSLYVTALIAWPAALGASSYSVDLKRGFDNWVTVNGNTSALLATSEITQEGEYTARVYAYNTIGTPSVATLSLATQIYWVTLSPPNNLALVTPWTGADVSVKWDAVDGAASYTVEIWNAATLRRTITGLTAPTYSYPWATNKADGGPWRALDIKVKAVGVSTESSLVTLAVSNVQHAAPSGLATVVGTTSVAVTVNMSAETDFSAFKFHMSTVTGFTPDGTNLVYDGPNNWFNAIGLPAGTPHYFKVTAYDLFDQTSLSYTTQASGSPGSAAGGLEVVSVLPTTGNFEGRTVYLTTDDKIWRYSGTAWVSWVDGSDILAATVTAGALNVVTLSAITANMGSLTSGNLTIDAAGYIRGGQTAFNTGSGFWLGYEGANYKLSIGNSAGNYLTWDGATLNINGSLQTISANGAITVGTSGHVKGGQTAYDTGSGFFIGYSGAAYKLSIGNSAGNKITWDGTNLSLTGQIIQTGNIVNGAVSNIINAYTDADISVSGTGDTTIQSAAITTTGEKVLLLFMARAPYSLTAGIYNLKVFRDTTLLWDAKVVYASNTFYLHTDTNSLPTISLSDSPAAGTYTYKVTCDKPSGGSTVFFRRSLTLQEIKK